MKKSVYLNIIIFILMSLLLSSTVIYAWFTLAETNRVQQFGAEMADYGAVMAFEVRKGDEDQPYMTIESIEDMHAFFGQTVPSDQITFRIQVQNQSNKSVRVNSIVKNMSSLNDDPDFYMLDVFYLKEGLININGIGVPFEFPEDKIEHAFDDVWVHGQQLNAYRFSNMVNSNNDFIILDNYLLEMDAFLTIEFTIVYDENTTQMGYHYGMFVFNAIYVELL